MDDTYSEFEFRFKITRFQFEIRRMKCFFIFGKKNEFEFRRFKMTRFQFEIRGIKRFFIFGKKNEFEFRFKMMRFQFEILRNNRNVFLYSWKEKKIGKQRYWIYAWIWSETNASLFLLQGRGTQGEERQQVSKGETVSRGKR